KPVADIVGDVASRSLDRARPLWEFWVIEGVEGGTVAIVARMHHATIDGVSGSSLLTTILDMEPDPVESPVVDDFTPEHKPSDVELVRHAIVSRLRRPLPLALALAMPAVLRGALAITRVRRDPNKPSGGTPFNTVRTPWNAPLTPHRRVAFASVSLDEVKEMKNAFGCTVNDIVLATATVALRRYLSEYDPVPD